jgi:uncharacterized delta-60 repeat protein
LRRGYALTGITTGFDYTHGLVLLPDGKIVVSGSANTSSSVVVRYNVDGTLDPGFGSAGIVQLPSGSPNNDLALQSDGKILVGGAGGGGFALVRLNTDGSLDTSFGTRGNVSANPSGSKNGSGHGWYLAIQRVPAITGEERIVLAGWSKLSSNDNSDWTLMRFRSNGAVDTTFGTSGIVKTYFSGFGDQARMVQIDSSNRIVVAGITNGASSSCGAYIGDVAVARYTQNGSLDGSFAGGKQVLDIYGGSDILLHGLVIQADGKILNLGTTQSSDRSKTFLMLVRLNADGSRDSSFGLLGNGVVTTDLYGIQSWGLALALSATDGKIVAAGGAYLGPGFTDGEIFVARYLP